MDFLDEKVLAVFALAISGGVAALQGWQWWTARHRVVVTITPHGVTPGGSREGGPVRTHNVTRVQVRNFGRPVTVEHVTFEILGPDGTPGIQWTTFTLEESVEPGENLPSSGSGARFLGDGEVAVWDVLVLPATGPPRPVPMVAKVTLSNGRTVTSNQLRHLPSLPGGTPWWP